MQNESKHETPVEPKNVAPLGQVKLLIMPVYGSVVKATKKLKRGYESPNIHLWREIPCEVEGLFLGTRTLFNGTVTRTYDEGTYFTKKDHFKCALVSPGPRENPVYVPLSELEA